MENEQSAGVVPYNLLINYKLVNNIINVKFNNASKRNPIDLESVKLWMKYLDEKNYTTLFTVKPYNGPFLVSFVSNWQKKVRIMFTIN